MTPPCPTCKLVADYEIAGKSVWCANCGTAGIVGEDGMPRICVPAQAKSHADVTAERDKLLAFKIWVHEYLDSHGVPHHPPGTHGAEGCRIGDRMDWLMAKNAAMRESMAELLDAYEDGVPQCHCANGGFDAPAPCTPCKASAALSDTPEART